MPLVIYSALRLGLFAALTLLMHFWAGMEWWFAALISVFAAWGLSYTMLDGPRDAAARYLADRAEERKGRQGMSVGQIEDAAVEDAAVDDAAVKEAAQDAAPEHVERDEP